MRVIALVMLLGCSLFSWAQSNPLIVANSNWIPYKDPLIEGGGLVTEITLKALSRSGYNYRIVEAPWKRALHETMIGNAHVIPAIWKTPERESHLLFSETVLPTRLVLMSLKEQAGKYQELGDLKGMTVGSSLGWAYPEYILNNDTFKLEEVTNLELNLKKLLFKRIKVIFAEEFAAKYTIKAKLGNQQDQFYFSPISLEDSYLHVGFSKKLRNAKMVVRKFDQALKSMKEDGTYQALLNKHL